ncbi:MAG TPA: hypothetical protein VIH35_07725 [Kiritimatiellia bacterium]|jgi:hypothetical protein
MKKLITTVVLGALLALPVLAAPTLQINGRVIRVTAFGGETTGYALKIIDGTVTINNVRYTQIDLDPRGLDMKPYLFRYCYVTGPLEFRTGTERGTYPVIGIESITKRRQ